MELNYEVMIEQTIDLMAIVDRDYIYRAANPAYLRAFGKEKHELIGSHVGDVLGDEQFRNISKPNLERAFGGECLLFHDWIHFPGIGRRYMDLSYSAVPDSSGRYSHCVITAHDITDRKQLEDELRQYAVLFEQSHEAIMITDSKARIMLVNPAFSDITGYSADEALGKTPRLIRSERHDTAFYQAFYAALEQEGRWQGEFWNRRKDGEIFPVWSTVSVVKEDDGSVCQYICSFSDISEKKLAEQQLHYFAYHDALTGLPNRLLFKELLEHAMIQAERDQRCLALLFLDLDRFKPVNDNYGHPVGDKLLQSVATRLKAQIRAGDTVARLGGDEFTVILESVSGCENVSTVAGKIIRALTEPFEIDTHRLVIGTSVGISLFPDDSKDLETLIRYADEAMYRAKERGRSRYEYYSKQPIS